jgi:hypothetical protein
MGTSLYAMTYCDMKCLAVFDLEQSNNPFFVNLFTQQTIFTAKIMLPRNKIV